MSVDGCLVFHDFGFFSAMENTHNIDAAELGAAFAPVAVGEDVVPTDFTSGAFFHTDGNLPMEQAVEAGDALSGIRWFNVLEEGGEAADYLLLIE